MKKSLITKGLIVILAVLVFALSAVGCKNNNGGDGANKDALNAEIALAITEQGDYTAESYNAYTEKLTAAKAVAENGEATQEAVDAAKAALSAAREALTVRAVEEVSGANKAIGLIPGDTKEINISDYVNVNGLSKITYTLKRSNAVVDLSPITDGKFTVTAGDIREVTDLTVSIVVYYDGAQKLKVELAVRISNDLSPTLDSAEVVKEYDLISLADKESLVIDFAENVKNYGNLALNYSAKCESEDLTLNGSLYTLTLGAYTEEYVYKTFTVSISYEANGESKTVSYTYKLGIRDTGAYGVANGGFENGLDGWTLVNTEGEKPFAGIDNKPTFWGEGYAMNNVGSYFSSYADGAEEASKGTLASPYFTVKSEYATYMLGGAGNHNVYITIENKDGEVLALYRNTEFKDFPAGDFSLDEKREMIGKTVFLANFVTYKVSLAELEGQEVRFVIHDYASSGWGVVYFDELITYYASSEALPEGAVLAENLLADKTALNALIADAVEEQGDYTSDSFIGYQNALNEAKALAADVAVTQEAVDNMAAALSAARSALTVREIKELDGAAKSFRLTSGSSKDIVLADYVDINGLSKITYEISASNSALSVGAVGDGKFTVTAGEVDEQTDVALTISVRYNGEEKLSVELSVQITGDSSPVLYKQEVLKEADVYTLADKTAIALDLSENVDNAGQLALSYSVNYGGTDSAVDGSVYSFTLGSYNEQTVYETLTVTVSFVVNEENRSVSYTYKLGIKDTTAYRLQNGGFENGLEGWNTVGNIGKVSSDKSYWVYEWENGGKGYEFDMDGEKMFSAYAPGAAESAVGTLTSQSFIVGGSGFISFKVGAMKDENYVYIDVVDAETKEILARYYNGLWAEYTDDLKSGCTLVAYKADLSAYAGKEVFFRISDNADSGYGLFFLDSFVTYYEAEPEGFNDATPVSYKVSGTIYDIFNGGFEMGDVQGWWNTGVPGHVTNADAFFSGVSYGKDGNYLYSGVEDSVDGEKQNNGVEGNRGSLTSSVFEIGGTGYVSFMLGGGGNSLCYVQIIDAVTGEILARYRQQAMQDAVLIQYVADLSAYIGRSARIQVVDQADRDWGCVSFDNVVTYYKSTDDLPEGLTAEDIKADIKYTIENGNFETGNLDGWTMNVTEAGTHNTLGWVLDEEIGGVDWYAKNDATKDGSYLFTFVTADNTNCENSKGTLQSSSFTLKEGAFVAFSFGGAGKVSNHDVYIELCRADGSVIARFYNDAEGKVNTLMNSYFYQYEGPAVECFFRVVDNSTGDYGCFVVDNFRVNLTEAPEDFIEAVQ